MQQLLLCATFLYSIGNSSIIKGRQSKLLRKDESNDSRIFNDHFGPKVNPELFCSYLPEILLMQDISSDAADDVSSMKSGIPEVFRYLQTRFKGLAKIGLVTFVDIAANNFGFESDFCAEVNHPLEIANKENQTILIKKLNELEIGGGYDWLEGFDNAMFRSALSTTVGWSRTPYDASTGLPILRIIIGVTDSAIHIPVYHSNKYGLNLKTNNLLDRITEVNHDINVDCDILDDPTPQVLREALTSRSILPVILSSGVPYYTGSNGLKYFWSDWIELMEYYNKTAIWDDVDNGLVHFYEEYLKEFLRYDGVVLRKGEDFAKTFKIAMDQVDDLVCGASGTTTTTRNQSSTSITFGKNHHNDRAIIIGSSSIVLAAVIATLFGVLKITGVVVWSSDATAEGALVQNVVDEEIRIANDNNMLA